MNESYTFEQIDAAFDGLDKVNVEALGGRGLTTAAAIPQVCPVYKAVRPFLVAVSNIPFIPQKWRNGIKTFIQVMDTICP